MPLSEYRAVVQETAESERVEITVIASPEIGRLPPNQAREQLNSLLCQVRQQPEIKLYGIGTFSSFVSPPTRNSLFGKNTSVEVNLGYCLHLPNGFITDVVLPDTPTEAKVRFCKHWTESAAGSNQVEAFANDRLIYHRPPEISTPSIPHPPERGVWPAFRGKNVEVEKDTRGLFRYSKLKLFFDMNQDYLVNAMTDEDVQERAIRSASDVALPIVNYVLDVYRFVTGETHAEPIWLPVITQVFFADHNLVFEGVTVPHGLRSAIANRSKEEIDRVAKMLSRGERPNLDVLLLQSARAALDRRDPLIAVIVAFQALEIYLETRLREGFRNGGLTDAQITQKLMGVVRTKDRLTGLCREVTGRSVADDTQFWNDWLTNCNRKRNEAVHRNLPVTLPEAERVVSLCQECIKRVGLLPFPQ
jgi:hypothetical protein